MFLAFFFLGLFYSSTEFTSFHSLFKLSFHCIIYALTSLVNSTKEWHICRSQNLHILLLLYFISSFPYYYYYFISSFPYPLSPLSTHTLTQPTPPLPLTLFGRPNQVFLSPLSPLVLFFFSSPSPLLPIFFFFLLLSIPFFSPFSSKLKHI